jgi:hypothetical protein
VLLLGCPLTLALVGGKEGERLHQDLAKICIGLLLSPFQTHANKERVMLQCSETREKGGGWYGQGYGLVFQKE